MVEEAPTTRKGTRVRQGVVVSKSGNKSLVVQVSVRRRHPQYDKILWHRARFHVHDENNAAKVGDQVSITECRPMSRLKRWRLVSVTATGTSPAAGSSES